MRTISGYSVFGSANSASPAWNVSILRARISYSAWKRLSASTASAGDRPVRMGLASGARGWTG